MLRWPRLPRVCFPRKWTIRWHYSKVLDPGSLICIKVWYHSKAGIVCIVKNIREIFFHVWSQKLWKCNSQMCERILTRRGWTLCSKILFSKSDRKASVLLLMSRNSLSKSNLQTHSPQISLGSLSPSSIWKKKIHLRKKYRL